MELRDWATKILSGTRIEDKLFDPIVFTDKDPGPAIFWKEPVRPQGMHFQRHTPKKDKLPPLHEHNNPDKVAVCLHRFCGHELLAVEMMAHALLAFPESPKAFRMGLANTLREEQGHVRLYMARLAKLGVNFGDMPLYRHFWALTTHITSPIRFVSMMNLTLEMANLDFAPHYGSSFKRHGDLDSYELMKQILHDEIKHVSFGMGWLKKLKEKHADMFDLYQESITPLLTPKRAKGPHFQEEPRRLAKVPESWIQSLKSL